jgi:hypothetical protein
LRRGGAPLKAPPEDDKGRVETQRRGFARTEALEGMYPDLELADRSALNARR